MRYYSPYSSRTRPPIWPKFLVVLLVLVILGSGGWLAWTIRGNQSGTPANEIKATVASASAATGNAPTPGAAGTANTAPVAQNGTVPIGPGTFTDPKAAAETYVQAWNAADYKTMYQLISSRAQGTIKVDAFQGRYESILDESGISAAQVELLGQEPGTSQYRFRVTFTSSLVGNITQENVIPLTREGAEWRVEWTPSLIFRELDGNGRVHFFPDDPNSRTHPRPERPPPCGGRSGEASWRRARQDRQ